MSMEQYFLVAELVALLMYNIAILVNGLMEWYICCFGKGGEGK